MRWECQTLEGLMLLPSRVILATHGGAPVIKCPCGHYQFDGVCYSSLYDLPAGRYRVVSGEPVPWHLYWRWRLKDKISWGRMVFRMVSQEDAYYRSQGGYRWL
jgi:hypothetical protein